MTTIKQYLASDALTCNTIVTAVFESERGPIARFQTTPCHPRGGGQLGCKAIANDIAIIDVRHAENGEVDHYMEQSGLWAGQSVVINVDCEVRANNARYHSAGHMIADAVPIIEPRLTPKQGHHWPGEARVEFAGEAAALDRLMAKLQSRLDKMVDADLPFAIVGDPFSSRALQIGDYPAVGCGGTHVATSAALSGLMVRKVQNKKGAIRVSYCFA